MKRIFVVAGLMVAFSSIGCGQSVELTHTPQLAPVSTPDEHGVVIKARSTFQVTTGNGGHAGLWDLLIPSALASGNQSVNTTLAAATTFVLDNSLFTVPSNPVAFAVNDFGFLRLTSLQDNNLNVCGSNGHTHCGTALIRMYTTGTAGAGLWNSIDQFGAPISAGQSTLATVGLTSAGAATMQQIAVANNKHVVTLADFTNPKYDVSVDFTSAGAGSYSTTVVVEYALAP
jgi:hypothetical protein